MTEHEGPSNHFDDLLGGSSQATSRPRRTPATRAPAVSTPADDVRGYPDPAYPNPAATGYPNPAPTGYPNPAPTGYPNPAPPPPEVPAAGGTPPEPATRRSRRADPPPASTSRRGRRSEPPDRGRGLKITRGRVIGGGVVTTGAAAAAAVAVVLHRQEPATELSATTGQAVPATSRARNGDQATAGGAGATSPVAGTLALPKTLDVEHLLRRVTYGPNDALRAEVAALGTKAWLTRQLNPAGIPDPGGNAVAALFPRLSLSIPDAQATITDDAAFERDLAAAHLGRAIWSSRQLFEVMVDFWSNHFNITCPSDKTRLSRHRFDADVIRLGALGRFEDLLQASAIHPAMLEYLDNGRSTGENPNENYARELLELHTVGPDGGYGEQDVEQAALLLTGYQVTAGRPTFVPALHHVGAVKVMGFAHPNDARSAGRPATVALLSYLARHPATAARLARKLAVRFVSDDPPATLVSRLAQVYLKNDTAIAPVLTALLSSAEFAASAGAKLRRPMERLAATARLIGLQPGKDPQGVIELYWMLDPAGHRPLGWARPDGYPDVAASWQSPAAALNQFNVDAQLVHGWWPKHLPNPGLAKLLRTPPRTRAAAVQAVGARILGRALTAQERAATATLLTASRLPTTLPERSWEQKETVGLIATLLLNSPAHLTR